MHTKILTAFLLVAFVSFGQLPDHTYKSNIRTVKLYKFADIYSYPVITLNTGDQLELHFDDMDADYKSYYYSFQLCNADWSPANVQSYDYIRGFQSNRITTYRNSSLADTRYTHYQVVFPERSTSVTKGGNYLLKVFLNDDTSKLVFTKRFLVVNPKASVGAQVLQPFNGNLFRTHQRVQATINTASGQLNAISPQEIKVRIVQNYAWGSSQLIDRPTIFRGNYYEYSDEDNTTFESGKEWRWIDLRSLRLKSERMARIEDADNSKRTDVYVAVDGVRTQQIYVYTSDLNGLYTIENRDNPNAHWQGDYAWTHFTYVPPGNRPYEGKSLYIYGELVNFEQNDESKMEFNADKGVYEKVLFLKQGYYNYSYITLTDRKEQGIMPSLENTEGNYWGTENGYMVLVYFRPFGARADELVGFAKTNSAFSR